MAKTRVVVLSEVTERLLDGETLCFQHVIYDHGKGERSKPCYRFMRRDSNGNLKAQMGQAAIPDIWTALRLLSAMGRKAFSWHGSTGPNVTIQTPDVN